MRGNLEDKASVPSQQSDQKCTLKPLPICHLEFKRVVLFSCQIAFQRLGPYFPFLILSKSPVLYHLHTIIDLHKLLLSFQNLQIHLPNKALLRRVRDLKPRPPPIFNGLLISAQLTRSIFLLESLSPHKKLR